MPPYLLAVAEDLVGEAGKLETAIIAAVSAAPSRAQLRPGQVCGFPSPHPDQGLTHGQGYQVGQGIAADRS